MFFVVSKLFWSVFAPSTFLAVLVLAGLLLALRWRRAGLSLAGAGVAALLLFGLSPLWAALLLPLENRFPVFQDDGGRVDGVVVLGGGQNPDISALRDQPAFSDTAERMMALAYLARRYPDARVVFSGGSSALEAQAGFTEAATVRRTLPWLGVPVDRVLLEDRSRNTWENAVFTRDLVQPRPGERWLLVTSAYHMPRAVGCFRAAGFPVTAFPVDFRTTGTIGTSSVAGSLAEGLRQFEIGLREWIGLPVYYATGRSSALFPAP
ncbi:YdcF family protein [Ancylobacter lacus]|uniref:YdcF family protein n=1 Tax=Ancylobacter lacus TaxID=2579970 RepID=UPI001BD1617F|nr:YdcF family protein [Ancylobacter lacus]